MANSEHLKFLKQGVEVWNQWRARHHRIQPDLEGANLKEADLSRANLSHAKLTGANLTGALLVSANGEEAFLTRAKLNGAKLGEARLSKARLIDADLQEANLHHANLTWANLRAANLSRANLSSANLTWANLAEANLAGANLGSANFTSANLAGASLVRANLSHADLIHTNLSEADLTGANVRNANIAGAYLRGADFQAAHVGSTTFGDCCLSEVEGLDDVIHHYPSTIGLDTIYASRGTIPEGFLRGCGVPENFIRYVPSLVDAEEGIQFYSCFISYSSRDEDFARRLHGRMRDAHLRVWFAPEDIQGGKKLYEQIEIAIRLFDKLLIVLSAASLQSEWVITELRNARKAERQSGKRKLFPVRLVDFETLRDWECFDSDSGKDLAVELREYFIPDFSNWKDHDQFETAFQRLLKDLRTEERAK